MPPTASSGRPKTAGANPAESRNSKSAAAPERARTAEAPAKAAPRGEVTPVTYEEFLAKLGQRDRTAVERHLTTLSDAGHAAGVANWRRLACLMAAYAPLPVQTVGRLALMFFIADGKYRMQGFALEDQGDGFLRIYTPDVLNTAVEGGQLFPLKAQTDPARFAVAKNATAGVVMTQLTATNTSDPPPHVKNMLGWNRKAVCAVLPADAEASLVEAVERLCAVAGKGWPAPTAVPVTKK